MPDFDLTKIQRPLCFIGEEKRKALKAHSVAGGSIEVLSRGGVWRSCPWPAWTPSLVYRAAPLTKPTAPWEVLPDWATRIATDENGEIHCYEGAPDLSLHAWVTHDKFFEITPLKGVTPGTCDWRDSLVEIPK